MSACSEIMDKSFVTQNLRFFCFNVVKQWRIDWLVWNQPEWKSEFKIALKRMSRDPSGWKFMVKSQMFLGFILICVMRFISVPASLYSVVMIGCYSKEITFALWSNFILIMKLR